MTEQRTNDETSTTPMMDALIDWIASQIILKVRLCAITKEQFDSDFKGITSKAILKKAIDKATERGLTKCVVTKYSTEKPLTVYSLHPLATMVTDDEF